MTCCRCEKGFIKQGNYRTSVIYACISCLPTGECSKCNELIYHGDGMAYACKRCNKTFCQMCDLGSCDICRDIQCDCDETINIGSLICNDSNKSCGYYVCNSCRLNHIC